MSPRAVAAIAWVARLVLIAGCVGLVVIAVVRDPNIEFDESNELRISAQPVGDIFAILGREQNFPLHYLVVHALSGLGLGTLPISLLGIAGWLASVEVLRRLFGQLAEAPLARLAMLLAMVSLPYFFIYAFTVRMYGLASLSIAVQLWCLVDPERPRWQLRCAQLAATLLHPIGIAATLASVVAECVVRRPRIGGPLIAGAANLAVVAVLVLTKSDLDRIYLGSGVAYIPKLDVGLAAIGPGYYELSLYGPHDGWLPLHVAFAVTVFVVVHVFVSRGLHKQRTPVALALCAAPFFAIPLVLPRSFSDHHTAFFVVPFAVFVIAMLHEAWANRWPVGWVPIGCGAAFGVIIDLPLETWLRATLAATIAMTALVFAIPRPVEPKGRRLGAVVLAGLAAGHLIATASAIRHRVIWRAELRDTCSAMSRLGPDDALLTSYTLYNLMAHCAESPPRAYFVDRGALVDTAGRSDLEILLEQATRNGAIDDPIAVARSIDHRLLAPVLARRPRRVAFAFPLAPCGSLRSIDVPGYVLSECRASVLVYERR